MSEEAKMVRPSTGPHSYRCPECYYDCSVEEARMHEGICPYCKRNDEDNKLEPRQSEFGAGLVICLVKFAEHLVGWHQYERIRFANRWLGMDESERDQKRAEAEKYPYGDTVRCYGEFLNGRMLEIYETPEQMLSSYITLWANGASDHFYDVDRERAPESLVKLADLMLEMGHEVREKIYTMDDLAEAENLYRQAAFDLDKALGVEAPDWGEY